MYFKLLALWFFIPFLVNVSVDGQDPEQVRFNHHPEAAGYNLFLGSQMSARKKGGITYSLAYKLMM